MAPIVNKFPLLAASYQLKVTPFGAVAVKVPIPPTQVVSVATVGFAGVGFTVMVKFIAVPIQPLAVVGLTVIVAVVALVRLLAVVNDGILPVPLVPLVALQV